MFEMQGRKMLTECPEPRLQTRALCPDGLQNMNVAHGDHDKT